MRLPPSTEWMAKMLATCGIVCYSVQQSDADSPAQYSDHHYHVRISQLLLRVLAPNFSPDEVRATSDESLTLSHFDGVPVLSISYYGFPL